ncbi:hypothetical protein [Curtobacterium sp. csp3]|uniref:hypothetical protein n=1 Tax=Curtobacterium sp. csp3 TaxID=2588937 RepID=UPI001597C89B|nr:hypothetical protein [Curtobacterium sp. csp3]QKS13562.1 hypothetical protein HUN60_10830 [Curtobacterium sp. csp3]
MVVLLTVMSKISAYRFVGLRAVEHGERALGVRDPVGLWTGPPLGSAFAEPVLGQAVPSPRRAARASSSPSRLVRRTAFLP